MQDTCYSQQLLLAKTFVLLTYPCQKISKIENKVSVVVCSTQQEAALVPGWKEME